MLLFPVLKKVKYLPLPCRKLTTSPQFSGKKIQTHSASILINDFSMYQCPSSLHSNSQCLRLQNKTLILHPTRVLGPCFSRLSIEKKDLSSSKAGIGEKQVISTLDWSHVLFWGTLNRQRYRKGSCLIRRSTRVVSRIRIGLHSAWV